MLLLLLSHIHHILGFRAMSRERFLVPSLFGVQLSSDSLPFSLLHLKSPCDSCLMVRLLRGRNGRIRGNDREASKSHSTVGGETAVGVETAKMVTTSGLGNL